MGKLMTIERDMKIVSEKFPKLKFYKEKKTINCIGEIDIFDKDEVYWDSFQVRFSISDSYPFDFPKVYETANRIPKEDRRHINTDKSFCLTVIQKELIRASRGITISDFLIEFVVPYLANQLYFEKHGIWANGDYLHGIEGIKQFYLEETKAKSIQELISLFENLNRTKNLGRNDFCFCGSKKKYKNCHFHDIETISFLPPQKLKEDYLLLLREV